MSNPINHQFWHGILLKLSFKPEKVKRTQAALIYLALTGKDFTADEVPKTIADDNTTAGCAVRTLAGGRCGLGLLQCVGRIPSPSKARHGAEVKQWRLAPGKRALALTWLERNGFDTPTDEYALEQELSFINQQLQTA